MIKICFIGLGSIGCRHFENLMKILRKRNVEFSIDAVRSSNKMIAENISNNIKRIYKNIDELEDKYDLIFITNPTNLHYDTIKKCVNKTKHIFIEKPIFGESNVQLDSIGFKENSVYYVACPLRYSSVIKYIKENITIDKVHGVRVIASSYLPDWRLNVDYRQSYSAKKEMGGGVHLDLIHEWDYIVYLFGFPQKTYGFMSKCSKLDVNSDDMALYVAKYKDMMLSLHLDYFGRCTKREIEIYMEDDVVIGDLVNNSIRYIKSGLTFSFDDGRNDYQKEELEMFLDVVDGKKENLNSPKRALKVLKLSEGEWI